MYLGRFQHIIEPRKVFVNGDHGQEEKPSDYQPSPAEIENGAWDYTANFFRLENKLIASGDYESIRAFSGVHWYTNMGYGQILKEMRQFYFTLYQEYERPISPYEIEKQQRKPDRLQLNSSIFDDFDGKIFSIDILMQPNAVESLLSPSIKCGAWTQFAISSPFGTQYFSCNDDFKLTSMGIQSWLDISPILTEYILKTTWLSLPPGTEKALNQFLSSVLGMFPQPSRKSTQNTSNNPLPLIPLPF